MTQEEAVERWRKSAEENLQVARDLMKLKHYDWALYMGQLVLEKLLKGLVTKNIDDAPPYTHDLKKLAESAKLSLSLIQQNEFDEITTFNITARYASIKKKFYEKATKKYTGVWFGKIEEYVLWLNKKF